MSETNKNEGLRELKIGRKSNIVRGCGSGTLSRSTSISMNGPLSPRASLHSNRMSIISKEDDALDVSGMVRRAICGESGSRRWSRRERREEASIETVERSEEEEEEEEEGGEDGGWQEMDAIASYDVYDENGELAVRQQEQEFSEESGDAVGMFGYTKALGEEQAERTHATNKKTDFLFRTVKTAGDLKEPYGSVGESTGEDEEVGTVNPAIRTTLDQLAVTKMMLSERDTFAYLGAATVLINQICTNLAKVCLSSKNVVSDTKLAQRLQFLQRDMGEWQQKICLRLYSHLGLTDEETQMIQKLSAHGIELQDLCKCLKTTTVIDASWLNKVDAVMVSDDTLKGQQTLEVDIAWTIICDLFLLLVQDSSYDARSRSFLIQFAKVLNISRSEICEFEKRIIDTLQLEQSTENQVWDEHEHMNKRKKSKRKKKLAYVGLATIGGSLVLGLSGGLLAPVIGAGLAASLSAIGVTSATGFLTGIGGTTVVTVSSTAIGANIGRKAMSRRMGSVKTFEFKPLHNNRRVNLIVSVSGWMVGKEDDVRLPFSPVDPVEGDLYSLYWEPDMLKSTGQTITILASEIVTQTIQQILGATVLTALMAAIQVPNLLSKLGYIIDNPWSVSLDRAWAAGLVLADTLISRNLGERPISLVGFSLGSRVIYSCLVELSKRGAIGLVEDVFIFGSPLVYYRDEMVLARAVVSGRFVNGYSDKDWILGYLFRATSGGLKRVAGISPIVGIEGIENIDCTDLVEGHMAYRKNIPSLLKKLGISVLSEEFQEIDDAPDPEQVKRERQLIHDLQDIQDKLSKKNKKNKGTWVSQWFKPKKEQWQEIYEEKLKDNTSKKRDKKNNKKGDENSSPSLQTDTKEGDKNLDTPIVDPDALIRELQNLRKAIHKDFPLLPSSFPYKEPMDITNNDINNCNNLSEQSLPAINDLRLSNLNENKKSKHEKMTFAFADDL